MQRISKSTISKISPQDEAKERDIIDAEVRGFGIRVRPKNDPTFYFRYQSPKTGKIRRISIGSCYDVSVDDARKHAQTYRNEILKGFDPSDTRKSQSKKATVNDLLDRFIEEWVSVKNKPEAVKRTRYLWDRFVTPTWGGYPVSLVTRGDAMKLLNGIKSKVLANRTRAALSKAFNLAEIWEIRQDGSNPFRLIEKNKEEARNRAVTPEEIQRLLLALDSHDDSHHHTVILIRLILLTGARGGEIKNALLSDVDWDQKILNIRDSKTGKGTIELTDEALDVIRSAKRSASCKYIVPSYFKGKPLKWPYGSWRAILKTAGLKDLRMHDLRHVFGTYAHIAGANQKQVAELLRHTSLATTERYIQGFKINRRKAAKDTVRTILGFKHDATMDVRETKH